jgi:hypothetical protein
MNERLGITPGLVAVTERLELATQLDVVVDLSVEHDPDRAVFIRHRLGATLEVDDAQPPVTQDDVGGLGEFVRSAETGSTVRQTPEPRAVRTAVRQRLRQLTDLHPCRRRRAVADHPRDPTHQPRPRL